MKKFYRLPSGWGAGICEALGYETNIDPAFYRIMFVICSIFCTRIFAVLYLLIWLFTEEKEIAVQVNGKVRATIKVNINDTEAEIREKALSEENVIRHTEGKDIVKVIVIQGKIVNIVVK